ncbi:hypothetical protein GEMRC1_004031 [Eukaryota sp. GEM-RC1]
MFSRSDFIFEEQIGKSNRFTVNKVVNRHTGNYAVSKSVSLAEGAGEKTYFDSQHTPHRNLMIYHACYQQNSQFCVLMDFHPTTLGHMIFGDRKIDVSNLEHGSTLNGHRRVLTTPGDPLPPAKALKYFAQLVSAVHHLHLHSLLCRDIKIENILIDSEDNVVIFDFDTLEQHSPNSPKSANTGTRPYTPPEVLTAKHHDYSWDYWSLGIVFLCHGQGKLPFPL